MEAQDAHPTHKTFSWELMRGRCLAPARFYAMAIVNVTPDSFYDGGRYDTLEQAKGRIRQVLEQGAKIVDIGGESTRPFADPTPAEDEIGRVIPAVQDAVALRGEMSPNDTLAFAVSVDTYKAQTAAAALQAGADIINDVSALEFDPELKDVLVQHQPGYVLMHSLGRPKEMQTAPEYDNVVDQITSFFENRLNELSNAGFPEQRIALDPGIGFGKTLEHNLEILRNINRFHCFGLPLMMGLSNKSLWSGLLGVAANERRNATQAATALMAGQGVVIHRVHEVDLTVQTLAIAEALG